MGLQLTDFERGGAYSGDARSDLADVGARLRRLQLSQIHHERKAMIVFEGWRGAGKKEALRALAGSWDPCNFATHCVLASLAGSRRHWLAPFWAGLPEPGHSAIFFRSWYRSMVDGRVAGTVDDKRWSRALDEINEFEAQQADNGTILVKLFFHVTADVQGQRLRERGEDPWLSWTMTDDDRRHPSTRDGYFAAWSEMFDQTDTRWAPWHVIDANNAEAARINALRVIADQFAKAVPLEPPATGATVVSIAKRSA